MKTECNVARDLMPLVLDDAASEESAALVREHIAECTPCAEYMNGMKSALGAGNKRDDSEAREFDKAAHRMRAKRRLRIWRNVLIGVMAGVVLALGGAFGWTKLTQEFNTLVYYGEYGVFLSQLADGRAAINLDFCGSSTWMAADMLEEQDMDGQNVLYVNLKRTRIRQLLESPNANYSCGRLSRDALLQYSEIRQGVPEEYCVVWRKGDEIPAASVEMETYFALENEIESIDMQETIDGKALALTREDARRLSDLSEQREAVRETVPEWQ